MVTKKKRPSAIEEEDLAAAVADMINSPITKANLGFLRITPPENRPVAKSEPQSAPMGLEREPMDVTSKPMGLELLIPPPPASEPLPPAPQSQRMWRAEDLETLFPVSRVRRIERAQDALSLAEERVYDLLWGPKNYNKDTYRLAEMSLQAITNESRLNIKTVRELLPRLIRKDFIAIEREADPKRNRPTQYRVWSYGQVLTQQKTKNRLWVVKTGKGVFYAHEVVVGVDPRPMGSVSETMGLGLKPMGDGVPALEPSPLHHDLATAIRRSLQSEPDAVLLDDLIAECHVKAMESAGAMATDEEILHFAEAKLRVLRQMQNLRNPLAVLRKAVPECFAGTPFIQFRKAEEARLARERQEALSMESLVQRESDEQREADARHAMWAEISDRHRSELGYDLQGILNDPELDDMGKKTAQERLRRVGRFSTLAL